MKKVNKYLWIAFSLYIVALVCFSVQNKVLHWSNLSHYDFILKSSNLIPFKTIIVYVKAMFMQTANSSIVLCNLLLPITVSVPVGFFLYAIINVKKSGWYIFLIGAAFSFFIELLQIIFRRGSFDIDDIILSLVGVLVGGLLYNTCKNILKRS